MTAPSLREALLARRNFPPFAADSDVLFDHTFTTLAAAQAAGLTTLGTGHQFDPNLGFNGAGTGGLKISAVPWALGPQMATKGTIWVQFQREKVTYNDTFIPSSFVDSQGGMEYSGNRKDIFYAQGAASTEEMVIGSLANLEGRYRVNNVLLEPVVALPNSHVLADANLQDPYWATAAITWNGTEVHFYADGHYVRSQVANRAQLTDSNLISLSRWAIGSKFAGDNYFPGWIKRVQMSKKFCPPVISSLRVAAYGDSNTFNMAGASTPGADTVAAITSAQLFNRLTPRYTTFTANRCQNELVAILQRLAWTQLGFHFQWFNSSKGNTGLGTTGGVTTIPAAYRNAIIEFKPQIIIMLLPINDVRPSTPQTQYVADIKSVHLDAFIDGIPNLRKIIMLESPFSHKGNTTGTVAGWYAEWVRLRNLVRSGGIDGYRGKVQLILSNVNRPGVLSSDPDDYDPRETNGAHPLNASTSAGVDVHRTATAYLRDAAYIWPVLEAALMDVTYIP